MKQANTHKKRKSSHGNLICQSLGLLLLAGLVPAGAQAQNGPRVVAPKARPWVTSTAPTSEIHLAGTIQQVNTQHGSSRFVVVGANGAVTADLGPTTRGTAKGFAAGDHIEIAGWMRNTNGKDVLVARQITAGERQVVIRNKNGILVHPAPATSSKPQRVGASFSGGAR
jgi:hypothetical protein